MILLAMQLGECQSSALASSTDLRDHPSFMITICLHCSICKCDRCCNDYVAPLINCVEVLLSNLQTAYSISKLASNLAIDKMHSAISKLCKFPNRPEHNIPCTQDIRFDRLRASRMLYLYDTLILAICCYNAGWLLAAHLQFFAL